MSNRTHGKKRKASKKIIAVLSGMLSVIIAICTTMILTCALLKGGLFSEQLFKQTLSESSYYDSKIQAVRNSVSSRLSEAGLPEEITDSVLSNTVITVDLNKIISGKMTSEDNDVSEFESKLNDDISEYLKELNVPVTDSIDAAVKSLAGEIAKSYDTQMNMSFAELYREFHEKYMPKLEKIMIVSGVLVFVCFLILMFIHSKRYRGLRYLAYGVLAGAISSEIFSLVLKGRVVNSIPDKGTEYYDVMIRFADRSFELGLYMSLAGVFVFCIIAMIISYFKKRGI